MPERIKTKWYQLTYVNTVSTNTGNTTHIPKLQKLKFLPFYIKTVPGWVKYLNLIHDKLFSILTLK